MGCTTSSANPAGPSSPSPSLHHTTIQTKATDVEKEDQKKTKSSDILRDPTDDGAKELPKCDTVVEMVEVTQRTSEPEKKDDLDIQESAVNNVKDDSDPELLEEALDNKDDQDIEERLSTLEEVVEKVVELYGLDNHEQHTSEAASVSATETSAKDETAPEKVRDDTEAENTSRTSEAGSASPSQSASSRATRWEALADAAAELPPSLAIDPLTGQIYALK